MECDTKSEITAKNVTPWTWNIKWFWFDPIEVNVYGARHKNEFNATNHMTQWSKQISVQAHTHTHSYMVLTTQHAFKHLQNDSPTTRWVNESRRYSPLEKSEMETQQQQHQQCSIRSQIEAYSSCWILLLFVLHSFVRVPFILFEMNLTSSCRSLFCFWFCFCFRGWCVVSLLVLFRLFHFVRFIIICFELLHFLFSLCVQLDDRIAGLSSTLFVHMHMHRRCDMIAVALVYVFCLFWFLLDLLHTQHETITHTQTMGLVKPHNTQLIRLNKCPNQWQFIMWICAETQNTIQLWLNIECDRSDNSTSFIDRTIWINALF